MQLHCRVSLSAAALKPQSASPIWNTRVSLVSVLVATSNQFCPLPKRNSTRMILMHLYDHFLRL